MFFERMLLAANHAGDEHARQSAPRQPRAGESRGEINAFHRGDATNVRQTVGGNEVLPRPALLDHAHDEPVANIAFQDFKLVPLVARLARLVVRAADDHQAGIGRTGQANVVIRIGVVPVERVGHVVIDAGRNHIRLVREHAKIKLRDPEERRMRGDKDRLGSHFAAGRFHDGRLASA